MVKRVMVVDDYKTIFSVYAAVLEGLEVVGFTSAFSALGALCGAQEHFDLLIVDLMMPGMDGVTFVRAVRAIESACPTGERRKIILSTGFSPDRIQTEQMIHTTDCDDFLAKPASAEQLWQIVRTQLPDISLVEREEEQNAS